MNACYFIWYIVLHLCGYLLNLFQTISLKFSHCKIKCFLSVVYKLLKFLYLIALSFNFLDFILKFNFQDIKVILSYLVFLFFKLFFHKFPHLMYSFVILTYPRRKQNLICLKWLKTFLQPLNLVIHRICRTRNYVPNQCFKHQTV